MKQPFRLRAHGNVLKYFPFCFHAKTVANSVNFRQKFEQIYILTISSIQQGVKMIKKTKTIFKTLENDARVNIAAVKAKNSSRFSRRL